MNISKGDYPVLIERICIAADKIFTSRQIEELERNFDRIGWAAAYRISSKIERSPNLPKNLYGLVLTMIDEERESKEKKVLTRDDWINDPDYASKEEFEWTMKCIAITCLFEGSAEACKRLGDGMIGAIKKDALLEFLKRYYAYYQKMKKERPDLLKQFKPFAI